MPSTFSPDPTYLDAGAGTAAAQAARPRRVADTANGGWDAVASGATAGSPGTYTPSGAAVPANRAALISTPIVASPATAWTVGQHVVTADTQQSHWNGTTWVAGMAPVAAEEPSARGSRSKS